MNRVVGFIGCVALGSSFSGPASADRVVAGHVELSYGPRAPVGQIADEFNADWANWRLAPGLRIGRIALGVGLGFGKAAPDSTERHSASLLHLSLGPELIIFGGRQTGLRPFVRLAAQRQWMSKPTVKRRCADFDVCEAGTWDDSDGYRGTSMTVALGGEYLFAEPARGGALLGLGVELTLEQLRFRVVDQDITGHFVGFNISIRVGGGKFAP